MERTPGLTFGRKKQILERAKGTKNCNKKVEKTAESPTAAVGRIGQLYVAFWIEPPVLAQAARSICVSQGCEDAGIENIC